MAQTIGSALTGLTQFNVNTLIPSLTDNADIQEALRLYHYGAPSGTGVGQYDPTNTNPANLVNPSIAHSLYSLQTQITNVSGSLGVQASTWNAKGALVSATAASTVSVLNIPTPATSYEGYVLTMNSGTTTGLSWASPVVTPTNTVTFTNKTLTAPKMTSGSFIADANGNELITFPSVVTSAVNEITVSNAATGAKPTISATGTDTNITLNLLSKGTGTVQVNSADILTQTNSVTGITNKTFTSPTINTPIISSPTISSLYLSDSSIIFEGTTNDAFETTLTVTDPTADRTITLPNVDGTVITTGNLSSITSVGTVISGTFPAANLSGTSLPATVVSSSLTSVGTITSGTWNGSTIAVSNGGTGLTSFTTGDIVYASAANTLAALADVATGNALISGGVGVAPSYGKIGLTTHISGTLAIGNGGTGQTTANASLNALLPSQSTNSGRYLTTDGTNTSWAVVNSYLAPTIGSTSIGSGATVTSIAGLSLSNATLTGTLTAGGGVGSSGQVLQSTGTGVQWSTPAAGYSAPTIGSTSIPSGTTVTTISGLTLTSPTLNAPTIGQAYITDTITFEGATNDAFETTLGVIDPTADRTINLPNVDGTVITTGNLSSITTVGTVTSGSFPAANLSGTALPTSVVSSSLTSLGTVTSGSFPAANLSGTTLASGITSSSLTSVGTLANLTVTNPISGSVTGSAGSVAASNITGTTLASGVTTSSLTSVGTLGSLSVSGNINAGSISVTGGVVEHISFNTTPIGSYTLITSDDGKIVEMPSGGNLTVPADGGTFVVPVGSQITILQTGSSQVTIVGSGATVNGTPGLKLRAQWSAATLIKRAANSWVAIGDLIQ